MPHKTTATGYDNKNTDADTARAAAPTTERQNEQEAGLMRPRNRRGESQQDNNRDARCSPAALPAC